MKAKLMALLMAVGLGVTGVAATVQAAEARSAHTHNKIDRLVVGHNVYDYDEKYHIHYYDVKYICKECGELP